jgi:Holliday junction resolvase-like predicted endonuclease
MSNSKQVQQKRQKVVKQPKEKIITEKRRIGNLGEDIGCIYLEKLGYVIVERNYLKKYGELDIIAVKAGMYHFIEVKTVTRATLSHPQEQSLATVTRETGDEGVIHETPINDVYRPEDNMHPRKLARLARTIQAYVLEKKVGDWQFDVMAVTLNMRTRRAKVDFMQNVVL